MLVHCVSPLSTQSGHDVSIFMSDSFWRANNGPTLASRAAQCPYLTRGALTGVGLTRSEGTCRCVSVPKSARTAPQIIWVPVITTWGKAPIAKVIGLIAVIVGSFVSGGMASAQLAIGVVRRAGGTRSHD